MGQTNQPPAATEQNIFRLPVSEWLITSLNLVRENDGVPINTAQCDVPLPKRTLQISSVELVVSARVLSTLPHQNVKEKDILDAWTYADRIAEKTATLVEKLRKPRDLSHICPDRVCERLEPSTHTMRRVRVSAFEIWQIDTTIEVKSI
jgi:hypothetical protein